MEDQGVADYTPNRKMAPALGLAWSWNRNEFAPHVATYRVHLCPLWGGASGHTLGALGHWQHRLDKEWKPVDALVIAASLFTLWRLYYDKRISAVHLMVETFEATFSSQIGAKNSPLKPEPRKLKTDDGFQMLLELAHDRELVLAVDPISLVWTLYESLWSKQDFASSYHEVKELINAERQAIVDAGYWLPQWSWGKEQVTATEVVSFPHGVKVQTAAAVKIQALWRGHKVRKELKKLKKL
jgi:hypothetical protein